MPETSALISVAPKQGRHYGVVGHTYRFLATGDETGGSYALMEVIVPPSDGPPPHHHTREEEAFFVIEGTVGFVIDGEPMRAEPGSFVSIPRGVVHTFTNPGPDTARMLIQVTPAGFEKFLQEVGVPMTDPFGDPPPATVQHIEKVVKTAPKYGIEIHLPQQP